MAIKHGRITAARDLIFSRYDPGAFVGRSWLTHKIRDLRDAPNGRHLIIVGEPGSGKSAFIAYLAEKWNCPRHFIRGDSVGGVLGTDPRTFLLKIGSQLYQKYGREIFQEGTGTTRVRVAWAKQKSEVVGRFINELYSLPFLPQQPRDVAVDVGVATGESRVIGEHISKLVDVTKALDETTLLHVAVIDPLLNLHEQNPNERVVVLIDALDESLEHPGVGIVDIIPRAVDPGFPTNLRIVMTSRPGNHLTMFRKEDLLYLDDQEAGYLGEHKRDVRALIKKRLAEPPIAAVTNEWQPNETDAYVRNLENNSEWNYLYLYYYFEELTDNVRNGRMDARSLPIPSGLDEIYRVFAVNKLRKNPLDRIQFKTTASLPEPFIRQLQDIEGVAQVDVTASQVEIMTAAGDKTLTDVFSLASGNQIHIIDLRTQKGTDVGFWETKYLPLLGVLAVAYEPLSRVQLCELAGVERAYVDSIIAQLRQFLDVDHSQAEDLWKFYHRSFAEYLLDRRRNRDYAVDSGIDKLIACCWRWSDLSSTATRDYILRRGLDHLLNRDLTDKDKPSISALDLCRYDGGRFLVDALRTSGIQRIVESTQRMLQGYLLNGRWNGAAGALVHLRAFGGLSQPLDTALSQLGVSKSPDTLETWFRSLEAISDGNEQRAIALATLAWFDANGNPESVRKLLAWLDERHSGSSTLGLLRFDSECLNALLSCASLPLAERIVDLQLYSSGSERLSALAHVWARDPTGPLRKQVLERLAATKTDGESFSILTLHYIALIALENADDEVLLEAVRSIGANKVGATIEHLDLARLLQRPKATIVECVRRLCTNVRLRKHPSLRAAVAGLILLGTGLGESTVLEELILDLSQVTGATIPQVLMAVAGYGGLEFGTLSMSLDEFRRWLTARVGLLMKLRQASEMNSDPALVNAIRRFVYEMSKVIRWLAAQAEISDSNWNELQAVLGQVSTLVWYDPQNWNTPFAFSVSLTPAVSLKADPVRAYAVADTIRWLKCEGWPAHGDADLHASLYDSSVSEITKLVFGDRTEPGMGELRRAILAASRSPQPKERGSLKGSPWLEVFRAIASSAGETWRANWTTTLDRENVLPEHFESHLRSLRGRVVEVAEEIGFHTFLLELSYYLVFVTNDQDLVDDELSTLGVPALANLDPELAPLILHCTTWPPHLVSLRSSRNVPKILAKVAASLELCDRGMLWEIARDMCRTDRDSQWLQSASDFRNVLRQEIDRNPHPRIIWYEKDKPPKEFVEPALAPLNLLLDTPPQKIDFDVLADEGNADPSSSCLRLKELVAVHPDPELLQWVAETFSQWGSEQAAWVTGILLRNRKWSLLRDFFGSQFLRESAQGQRLSFEPAAESSEPTETLPAVDWRAELEEALGIGPEEGLIYRIADLAQRALNQTLFQEDEIQHYREKITYALDWEERLRNAWRKETRYRDQFIRTLLMVALLRNESAPALLAEELVRSASHDLEDQLALDLAWTGRVVCAPLANDKRLAQLAASGNGLALLTSLGKWDLVAEHLEAKARTRPNSVYDRDPLLQWYHQCDSLPTEDQKKCLEIFEARAPSLLAQRPENVDVVLRRGIDALLPVDELSATLQFSEWSLSKHLLPAALAGDLDRLSLWFKAVLIEARFGPKRTRDLECFGTVCRCAGIVLSVLKDRSVLDEWLGAIRKLSVEFGTRELWNSFFGGAGMALGPRLGIRVDHWYLRDETRAVLALGEELAEYGSLNDVRVYWSGWVEEDKSLWTALRACAAVISRSQQSDEASKLACYFASWSWTLAQSTSQLSDPKYLAQIIHYSVLGRCNSVVSAVADSVAGDIRRAQSIGRIGLDSCLASLSRGHSSLEAREEESIQSLREFLESTGFRPLIDALIQEGASPAEDSGELEQYQHTWQDKDLQFGIQWIAVLLDKSTERGQPLELASWLAGRIKNINPARDRGWEVAKRIVRLTAELHSDTPREVKSLLDFAISSASCEHGTLTGQVDLILDLIKGRYRVVDCLTVLDRSFKRRSQTTYVDASLARVAAVTAELFPKEPFADEYLARMQLPAEKAVANDKVAELRERPRTERLENLKRAPQSPEVIKRTLGVTETLVNDMAGLKSDELDALGGALIRLVQSHESVYQQVGTKISAFLSPTDFARVRNDQERLQKLSASLV